MNPYKKQMTKKLDKQKKNPGSSEPQQRQRTNKILLS